MNISNHINMNSEAPGVALLYDQINFGQQFNGPTLNYIRAQEIGLMRTEFTSLVRQFLQPIRVASLGIGSGDTDVRIIGASSYKNKVFVDGYDISRNMLKQAEDNLTRAGIPFCLQQSDLSSFKPVQSSYELMYCQHVLCHLDDEQVFRLFTQVRIGLRPGGSFIFCELIEKLPPNVTPILDWTYPRPIDKSLRKQLQNLETYRSWKWYLTVLQQAGLVIKDVVYTTKDSLCITAIRKI